jgi:tetratricopeptide (TPR) repeat protein
MGETDGEARKAWISRWLADFEHGDIRLDSVAQLRRMLTDAYDLMGAENPLVLSLSHHLADAYLDQGDVRLATAMYERTFRARAAVLGPVHPDTLMCANSLGVAYLVGGLPTAAAEMLEETLATAERALGSGSLQTLTIARNLADAHVSLGRRTDAVRLVEWVLMRAAWTVGTRHPFTTTTRRHLRQVRSLGRSALVPAQRRPCE